MRSVTESCVSESLRSVSLDNDRSRLDDSSLPLVALKCRQLLSKYTSFLPYLLTFLDEKDFFLGINLSFGSILGLLNSSGFFTLNIEIKLKKLLMGNVVNL